MQGKEDEHCEFKEARNQIDSHDLTEYCIALANERGGRLVLGMTNRKPRQAVGTQACRNLEETKQTLLQRIHFRVDVFEIEKDGKRVLVFNVPRRPIGTPLQYRGRYLMRSGEALTAMTPEQLQAIFAEEQPDYSATLGPGASLSDLDLAAIERFRSLWQQKSGNRELATRSHARLLADAELLDPAGGVRLAGLILLGKAGSVSRF